MDYAHNKVMTFDNPNDAYRWSDDGYQRFPHCRYIVMEYYDGQEKQTQNSQSA